MKLTGNVALVSGAARGIGRAIALRLAQEGARVVATDLPSAELDQTGDDLRAIGANNATYSMDLRDPAAIAAGLEQIGRITGGITILVNNAAVSRQVSFLAVTPEDIDLIMDVNFRASLVMMQHAARQIIPMGRGRIINISSIAGKGFRQTSNIAYAGSKGALITMSRIAASDLGRHGITVNSVCPGTTESRLMLAWLERKAAEEYTSIVDMRSKVTSVAVLDRMNVPEDIASTVAFLASEDARNITGQSINVDGGTIWD